MKSLFIIIICTALFSNIASAANTIIDIGLDISSYDNIAISNQTNGQQYGSNTIMYLDGRHVWHPSDRTNLGIRAKVDHSRQNAEQASSYWSHLIGIAGHWQTGKSFDSPTVSLILDHAQRHYNIDRYHTSETSRAVINLARQFTTRFYIDTGIQYTKLKNAYTTVETINYLPVDDIHKTVFIKANYEADIGTFYTAYNYTEGNLLSTRLNTNQEYIAMMWRDGKRQISDLGFNYPISSHDSFDILYQHYQGESLGGERYHNNRLSFAIIHRFQF